MISRSDGKSFHLLLADRPVPYPNKTSLGRTYRVSACYWYSHVSGNDQTRSTIVVLPCPGRNCPALFRLIESAADLLAKELSNRGELADFYEFIPVSSHSAGRLRPLHAARSIHPTRTGTSNKSS